MTLLNEDIDNNELTSDNSPKCRKWLLTANNPQEHGWEFEKIVDILNSWKALEYWCIGFERGVENDVPHYHIYLLGKNQIKAFTIHNKLKGMNRKMVNGSNSANRDYCWKTGKWQGTEKELKHDHSFDMESGEMPEDVGQGYRADLHGLYDMIKCGKSNYEILEENPTYIDKLEKMDKVRQIIRDEMYKDTWRNLDVVYVWGVTGAGKTRGIMDKYGYSNVYRVTDYMHPFDNYKGQDVIMFEEFRSDLPLTDMLKYLDGYPLELPSRYNNKVACFTKVYVVSNIDIREQYPNRQKEEPESWSAFLRRIHRIQYYSGEEIIEKDTQAYINDDWHFIKDNPFDDKKQ